MKKGKKMSDESKRKMINNFEDRHGVNNSNYRHGLRYTKEYRIWQGVKKRCFNKKLKRYKDWGGRGITMHEPWINDVVKFVDYIKSLPDYGVENYTLDRINNDGNYEPGNLRWTNILTQNNNRRKKSTNKSGYTGIFYYKGKYQSRINNILIDTFYTKKEALEARNKYIVENNLPHKIQEYKND